MEQKVKLFKEIVSKEEVGAKLTSTDNLQEMLDILAANGLELTVDEFGAVTKAIAEGNADGELNENDLEDVSGGSWIGVVIKIAYYGYKIYQALKR